MPDINMKSQKLNATYSLQISQLIVFIFLFVITACPTFGQAVNKKTITVDDYSKWSTLYTPVISNDGKWAAFTLRYQGIADSLIVMNIRTQKTMKYRHAIEYVFSPNSKYIFNFEPDRTLKLINLANQEVKNFPDLELFYYSDKGDYAGVLEKNNTFSLIDLETEKTSVWEGVTWFNFSPDGKWVAITFKDKDKSSIELMATKSHKRSLILSSDDSSFSNMVWNNESVGLAFVEVMQDKDGKPVKTTLYEFRNGKEPKLRSLHTALQKGFSRDTYIDGRAELFYAADGQRIFFNVRPKSYLERNIDTLKNNVQVWKGDDKWIVPRQLKHADPFYGPWLTLWNPEKKEVLQLADEGLPIAFLLPKENYALLYDPKQYEPSFQYNGDADFYVMDLETKEKKLMTKEHTTDFNNKYGSPNGKNIAYYRDGKWWVYDIIKNTHTDLSSNIPFKMEVEDRATDKNFWLYGFAGWSEDSKWVFIYDEFDIWKVAVAGSEYHRITQGREEGISFRVYERQFEEYPFQRFAKFSLDIVNTKEDVILEAKGKKGSGYYIWNSNGIEPLFMKGTKIENLKKAKEGESYIVQEESYDIPKRIYLLEDGKESLLYESNAHAKEYVSPRQEMIQYKSFDGRNLQGILMYPDGYEEGKQYPMIVHVYERLSSKFHDYQIPTLYNSDGFNPKIYTGQGYFVLYPDIVYKLGDPGMSALKCVKTAVATVLKTGKVDKDRLGLQGHSYGGYEAAFIATQTDIFAAIVSSAGVTDFLSFSLTVNGHDGRHNAWWLEEHQWRMGLSYFDDPEAYNRNSPIHQIKNVNTPVLLWSGAEDFYIDVRQNIEYYLALRRLGKKVTFLSYPNESHALTKPKNQQDVTKRISDWFALYLKP